MVIAEPPSWTPAAKHTFFVALIVTAGALHLPCPVDDAVCFGSTAGAWLYDTKAMTFILNL